MKRALLLGLLAVSAACATGPRVATYGPAVTPAGVHARLLIGRKRAEIRGELLEVRDSALLIVRDGTRVTLVPIDAIRYGDFSKMGPMIAEGELSGGARKRLRLVSRFPAGLSPELEAQLLRVHGQTEPDRVNEPPR